MNGMHFFWITTQGFYTSAMQSFMSDIQTAIGILRIDATDRGIANISFVDAADVTPYSHTETGDQPHWMSDCKRQLEEYFEGTRMSFTDLPLIMRGTDFQQAVWEYAMTIPFGETVSYGTLAASIGDEDAARAVGSALGRNHLGIVIPCHRIITSSGDLGGFGWGVERKKWLLTHEQGGLAASRQGEKFM